MASIASLLPGATFSTRKKTDSELYLPKWVRTKPEDMLKMYSDHKPKKKLKRSQKQRNNLYNLRGILDDKIMQKLEEAEWLSTLIKRSLNGVLSKKIKSKALKKTLYEGLGVYEMESEEKTAGEQEVHLSKMKPHRKINKERFNSKQLFRDRLRWERMNEWSRPPPPVDTAETVYSQNFLAYLTEVKLPGKNDNLKELENLYKTYKQVVVPKPKRDKGIKKKARNYSGVRALRRDRREALWENRIQEEGIMVKKENKSEKRTPTQSDLEGNPEQEKEISSGRITPLVGQQISVKSSSGKESRHTIKLYSRNKKRLVYSEGKNKSETSFQLREKLSLTSVFRRKATLLSLTSVNKRSPLNVRKDAIEPLDNGKKLLISPNQCNYSSKPFFSLSKPREGRTEQTLSPTGKVKSLTKRVTFETPLSSKESYALPKYVLLKVRSKRNCTK